MNTISRKQKKQKTVPDLTYSSDEESKDDSEEDRTLYNVVDSLQHSSRPPTLTVLEKNVRRKFTYDKQKYKEFSDYNVLQICNNLKKSQINKIIGSGLGYENNLAPISLYEK